MTEHKRYLGDGVYAALVPGYVVLTAENGIVATDTIYLEPAVLDALAAYRAEMAGGPHCALRVKPHSMYPDRAVCEVWWGDQFVATVTTVPGEGVVRVISKHPLDVSTEADMPETVNVANVRLAVPA